MYSPIQEVRSFSQRYNSEINSQPFKVRLKASEFMVKVLRFLILAFYCLAQGNLKWWLCLPFSILYIISQVPPYVRPFSLTIPRVVWYMVKDSEYRGNSWFASHSKISYHLDLSSLHYLCRSGIRLPQGTALSQPYLRLHFAFLLSRVWH